MIGADDKIELLKKKTELAFGRQLKTPKDFEQASQSVFEHTGVLLSATTFKRIWNYINEPVTPRTSTLDILARYVGRSDWGHFCRDEEPETESGLVYARGIDVSRELKRGDRLVLMWQPNRVCHVRYQGDGSFIIEQAEGTKLQVGSTFTCHAIVSGEPLYLLGLTAPGHAPGTYVCGRTHGVTFRLMP